MLEKYMAARAITEHEVRSALAKPGQVIPPRPGRQVVHTIMGQAKLLRVFVDVDRRPPEIVTVYLTSKITKYWMNV